MGGKLELGEFADPFIGDSTQRASEDRPRYPYTAPPASAAHSAYPNHNETGLPPLSGPETDFESYNDYPQFTDPDFRLNTADFGAESAYQNQPKTTVGYAPNASPAHLFRPSTAPYTPYSQPDLLLTEAFDDPAVSNSGSQSRDPVINVVAPDELLPAQRFPNEAFPLYNAEGKPVDCAVSEFHHSSGGDSDSGRLISGDQCSLSSHNALSSSSPMSNGTAFGTPYGTPSNSSFAVPGTPLSIKTEVSSDCSPLLNERFASPYDTKFDPFGEEGLSPLVEDGPPLLFDRADDLDFGRHSYYADPMGGAPPVGGGAPPPVGGGAPPPMGGGAQMGAGLGSVLNVPRRKSRALSDSRTARERAALLESLDRQSLDRQSLLYQPPTHHPDPDPHFDAHYGGYTPPPYGAHSPTPFPAYAPVNIVPHTSSETPPTSNLLSIPTNARARSSSSPFEPTSDLKAAQMFSCELCGKRFTRAYNLRSHMRTHTDERPFACQHCGKAFARQHDRKRHEALHSGQKKFVCAGVAPGFQWGCQKRFARADALGRHFRTEAGKNCLRPLINEICANGARRDRAPEGILYSGTVNRHPQLSFVDPDREATAGMSLEEREDQTRRTVIITAVAEQLQDLLNGESASNYG